MLKRARKKGSGFELYLVNKFKELGYDCSTSRFSSREMDSLGVDLCGLPFHVQAKAVERLGPPHPILDSMPKDEKLNLLFHKMNRKGVVVSMTADDFFKVLQHLIDNKVF